MIQMTLYTDPYGKSGFPQGWTIFYWAWFLNCIITYAIYLVRISKGRTVREFGLAVLGAIVLGEMVFFAVFTNYAMFIHQQGILNIGMIVEKFGTARAIVEIWGTLPLASVVLPVLLVYAFIATATFINLVVMSRDSKNPNVFTEWFVDMKKPGIKVEKLTKLGLKMDSCCEVYFDNVELEEKDMFGQEGNGFNRVKEEFDFERFLVACCNYGTALCAFEDAAKYANQREQFGEKIARFQLIQEKFCNMAIKLTNMRNMVYEAAWKYDNGLAFTAFGHNVHRLLFSTAEYTTFNPCRFPKAGIFTGPSEQQSK